MRSLLKLLIPFSLAAVVGAGCSLLVNFDPEGQPCDDQGGCLAGYGCVDRRCVKGADGGTSVCGTCGPGMKCLENTRSCVPNTCQYTRCVVGSICTEDTGTPVCRPVQSPALGHPCVEDVDCSVNGANRFCLRGAVQSDNAEGTLRTGICVERCPQFGGACLTSGATCRPFALGLDAGVTSLCVPDNLLASCRTNDDCIDPSFVCTVFDNPNLGPATLCDAPLTTGTQPFLPCTSSKADGGTLPYCGNGLCIPQDPIAAVQPTCGSLCNEGTCATSQVCRPVEFTVKGTPRFIPMCIPAPSACKPCADSSSCNADAPRCTLVGTRNLCLADCVPDGGTANSCPGDTTCQATGTNQFHCLPPAGCP